MAVEQVPIPEIGPEAVPVPSRIIVRTIGFEEGANGGFVFVAPDEAHPCDGFDDIHHMVGDIRNGGYTPGPPVELYHRPLDLNLSADTCFILRLGGSWPWRFRHLIDAVTLGPEADQDNYFNLRHVLDDDVGRREPFPHLDRCTLCYFIARPPQDVIDNPGEAEFADPFNLNIDFVYPDGGTKPNTVPVVIDPDVRYPGGSG